MKPLALLAVAAVALAAPSARAQDALERRAREAAALIAAEPTWPDDLFDKSFVKQVPPEQLRAIGRDYFEKNGALVEVQLTQRKSEFAGTFDLILAQDKVVPMTITLSEKAPHSVVGLWFGLPSPLLKDIAAAADELKKLPGTVSFAVWKLGGEKAEVLAELNPDAPLAIGSAFKLYVLGALAEDVAKSKRKLSDVVALEERHRSLPSGQMQAWPAGAPATLATLAALMISISDNTATDHLLATLGRERVETMLATMGNAHAERSIPFLATHELFRLKMTRGGADADEYLKLDVAAKREFLAREVASRPLEPEKIDVSAFTAPSKIDTLEWFASASDLCRALDWLRTATESGAAAPLRGVLAINRGLDISKELFPWVGFKGGSEPGVINLSFLLQSRDGSWYALSAGWNDPAENVDEARLTALVQRAIYVLGKRAAAK